VGGEPFHLNSSKEFGEYRARSSRVSGSNTGAFFTDTDEIGCCLLPGWDDDGLVFIGNALAEFMRIDGSPFDAVSAP
jgi:hypothetical protein